MKLLHAKDINGRLPWELAGDFGHDELASYLFCRTASCEIARLSTMSRDCREPSGLTKGACLL